MKSHVAAVVHLYQTVDTMNKHRIRWRWVPGYEEFYKVSNTGKVKSVSRYVPHPLGGEKKLRSRILKPGIDRNGYRKVVLCQDGNKKEWKVHRLVLLAFKGPPPKNKPLVCHKDDNPANNRLSNLRYGTAKINSEDMVKHGNSLKGEKNHKSILTEKEVLSIVSDYEDGLNRKELAEKYEVNRHCIYDILNGRSWGYLFE